jgi:hypothetical protein
MRVAQQAFNVKLPQPAASERDPVDEALELPMAVALGTWEMDERIIAQSGTFTVHADPRPLDAFPESAAWLLRFRIPAKSKPLIRDEIERLGVQSTSLFPDLVNLGTDLARHDVFFSLSDTSMP